MRFTLVHEVGNRQRWRTKDVLSDASANLIADDISAIGGIDGVIVNPRTGSVLITWSSLAGRDALAAYLAGLQANPPALRSLKDRPSFNEEVKIEEKRPSALTVYLQKNPLVRAIAETYKRAIAGIPVLRPLTGPSAPEPEGKLDFSPLMRWVAVRPMLPMAVNTINALIDSVPYVFKGLGQLIRGKLNVSVLDAAAIGISLLRRDFRTASLIVLLLGMGDMLENYTRKKSMASLADQLALKVDKCWVRRDGAVVEVPMNEVTKNDVIVVRAGSTIPVDGKVVAGEAAVNQATMTGEPLPVHRCAGGAVFAGTVVEDGEIDIEPTKMGDSTRLNEIVRFIEESEKSKAGIQGRAERLADRIVPYNFALAGGVYGLTRDLNRTASCLMVDYSCAIKLATPLSVLTSMREGTREGVLVKGGRYLEALAEVDTVVFDKTGTLTQASPKLSDVVALADGWSEDEVLRLAACLEEHFPHPVSRCVVDAAKERGLSHYEEEHDTAVKYVVAHGICSSIDGEKVYIGSRHFIAEDEGIDCSKAKPYVEKLAKEGKSILYMGFGDQLIGILGIVDPIRPEAPQVIAALRERGISRIVMLTGDDERTAANVARMLGVDAYRAQVLPSDKSDYVTALKAEGRKVMMVGDGINDSPALSCADVGVTLREGTAIAQEVADVVLTNNTLADLPLAVDLGRATLTRIKANFGISVLMNTGFIVGGLMGVITPAIGAILHNVTTIGVCLNAMRSTLGGGNSFATLLSQLESSFEDAKQGGVSHAAEKLAERVSGEKRTPVSAAEAG